MEDWKINANETVTWDAKSHHQDLNCVAKNIADVAVIISACQQVNNMSLLLPHMLPFRICKNNRVLAVVAPSTTIYVYLATSTISCHKMA